MDFNPKQAGQTLTAQERALARCDTLIRLTTPIWFYDFDACAVVWANPAALAVWNAETNEELAARRLKAEMSSSVSDRLSQLCEDFERNPELAVSETWTLYPGQQPRPFECIFHDARLAPGRRAAMIEGRLLEKDLKDQTTARALDALLHSQVMTALFDHVGRRLYANRAMRVALGPGAETFGANFARRVDVAGFLDAAQKGEALRSVVKVVDNGAGRWHDIQMAPCRDAATGDDAFQITAVDVTRARRYETDLRRARGAAERANEAKSEFLASMSHEMRTPMNGVLGILELLSHAEMAQEQAELVAVAKDSGFALLELIEDALDITSIELGAVRLEPAPFDLREISERVVAGLEEPARRKGLRLSADLSPHLPCVTDGDARRVAQVMRNLIGNAIKYTQSGEITMRVGHAGAADRGDLLVEVNDTGPGVPKGQRDLIFERFHQDTSSRTKRIGGVGLGLAICKEIVTLWGGQIGVREARGGGSCFWFSLPGAQPSVKAPSATSAPAFRHPPVFNSA